MKNYKNFVLESLKDIAYNIGGDEFDEIFEKCCVGVDLENDTPIMRSTGIDYGELFLVDPRKFERKSAHTLNYYTIFMDNDPSWSEYPKRSHGIISAFNDSYMDDEVFRVIPLTKYDKILEKYNIKPFTTSKWGICPTRDIWSSIYKTIRSLIVSADQNGRNGLILELLNSLTADDITHIYYLISDKHSIELSQTNYEEFRHQLISLTDDFLNDDMGWYPTNWCVDLFQAYMKEHNMNLFDLFAFIFDPVINEFKVKTYEEIQKENWGTKNEVWTDTPVLYVKV
jgi:hypothetical protein